MNAEGMTILAGGIAFAGNMKKSKGFPPNGITIIAATVALTLLYSLTSRGKLDGVSKGLAMLTLLASVSYYVPYLTKVRK